MKILLATDGSESAQAAVDLLEAFPFPRDSEVIVLTVIDHSVFRDKHIAASSDEHRQALEEAEKLAGEEAGMLLADEAARLRKAGWTVITQVRTGHPAEEIIRAAGEPGVDLVMVGSHGLAGVKRFLLGSVSEHVLKYARCSVLIVRKPETEAGTTRAAETMPRRLGVLLAFDDSAPARRAVELCASLPLDERAEVTALTVLPLVTVFRQDIRQRLSYVWQEKKKAAHAALDRVTSEVRRATPHVTAQLRERPDESQAILDAATELNSDLIILGYKGKSAIEKFLLGSVTTRVARHAPCSVLAVRT
jgi:nucleotide-binding universal stress UspA family protein